MSPRRQVLATFGLALLAGVAGLGLGRWPEAPQVEQGPLLVTSSLGATSAILFVLDPATKNLAAYEAMPGENGGLRLLGSRKIQHDLELARYRDRSEFSFFDLRDKKNEVGGNDGEASRTQSGDRR